MLRVGEPAPGFETRDQDGRAVRLSDFRGKWLVLYFYPRDMTLGCTKEAMGFRDVKNRIHALGAEVLGVSTDAADAHRNFVSKCSINFPLLVDPERRICRAYGALGPISGFLDQATRITYIIGPDGRVALSYRFVNPLSHAPRVLADLERLQSERKGSS